MDRKVTLANAFDGYRALLQKHLAGAVALADRSDVLIGRQEELVSVLTARGRDTAAARDTLRLARTALVRQRQRIADMAWEMARLDRMRL